MGNKNIYETVTSFEFSLEQFYDYKSSQVVLYICSKNIVGDPICRFLFE